MVSYIYKIVGIENYVIVYVFNLKLVEKLKIEIIKKIGKVLVYVGEILFIIVMNLGLNFVVVGLIRKDL